MKQTSTMKIVGVLVLAASQLLWVGCEGSDGGTQQGPALEGDVDNGQKVYMKRCSQCHGIDGAGDGYGAKFMLPRPRVFKDNTIYKFRTTPDATLPSDWDLFNIISRGLPGSSMPAFDVLPEQERWDVVAYIKSLAEDFDDEDEQEASVPEEELLNPSQQPPADEASLTRGKELYQENKCWQCHGQTGRGNGESWPDIKDTDGTTPWKEFLLPANLNDREYFRGGNTAFDIYRTLTTGIGSMPSYRESITPEDRWHLVNYVLDIGPADKEARDDTVKAQKVESLPADHSDEAWADVNSARFSTLPNIIEAPRLFWNIVEFINIQAVYTDSEIALRIQWDDRTNSKGSELNTKYEDRDTKVYRGTQHPDQFAVQFPSKEKDATTRPYFMMGDSKRAVNLWWWQAHTNVLTEYNAKGYNAVKAQSQSSQSLQGGVSYEDGRYTMLLRRTMTTDNHKNDAQFSVGAFTPIAFHVWDGDSGQVGQRRSLTTWYWLTLTPPLDKEAQMTNTAATGIISFILLFLLFTLVQRRSAAATTEE